MWGNPLVEMDVTWTHCAMAMDVCLLPPKRRRYAKIICLIKLVHDQTLSKDMRHHCEADPSKHRCDGYPLSC
jgi:hypothetical protein